MSKIVVALPRTLAESMPLLDCLVRHEMAARIAALKIGLRMITRGEAHEAIRAIRSAGGKVFYDGKLHDIPSEVEDAAYDLAIARVDMFTVHAMGGSEALRAAVHGVARAKAMARLGSCPKVLGVTILTSMDNRTAKEVGLLPHMCDSGSIMAMPVARLATLAHRAGLDGVISSSWEASAVRILCGPAFRIMTPGIRPDWAARNEHKRSAHTA